MATAANTVGCTEVVIARILQGLGCELLLVLVKRSSILQLMCLNLYEKQLMMNEPSKGRSAPAGQMEGALFELRQSTRRGDTPEVSIWHIFGS